MSQQTTAVTKSADRRLVDAPLLLWLWITLCLATLTLWLPAYWPVGAFETSLFLLAAVTLLGNRQIGSGTRFPLFVFGFIVLWGCLQLVSGRTVNRFATERATVQWMTWLAFYYAAVCQLGNPRIAQRLRTVMVWFGSGFAIEAILQAYLSPGDALVCFPLAIMNM